MRGIFPVTIALVMAVGLSSCFDNKSSRKRRSNSQFSGATEANPFSPPNHPLSFGYYFADGRYGNHVSEVWPYTNLYVALNSGYDTSLDWRNEFRASIRRAGEAGKEIFLLPPADSDWNEVLDIVAPYWSQVKAIEIAHEEELTIAQTEEKAASLNSKIDAKGLSRKTLAITQTQKQSLETGQAMFAPSVGLVLMEAYVDAPGSASSSENVARLNAFLDAAKARVPREKQIGIIMQSYDRNGTWPNIDTLADIQAPAYLKAYNDPRVSMLLMFAYARTGGAKDHPQLKYVHQQMASAIFGTPLPQKPPRVESTVSRQGPTYALNTTPVGNIRGLDIEYDKANKVFLVVHGNFPVGGAYLDDNGNQVGNGFQIPTVTDGWPALPRASCSNDGTCLVTWHDARSGLPKVMGRFVRYTAGGAPNFLAAEFEISQGNSWHESPADVAYSSEAGEFLVTWIELGYTGTLAQRISDSGNLRGSPLRLTGSEWGTEVSNVAYNPTDRSFNVITRLWDPNSVGSIGFRKIQAGTGNFLTPLKLLDQGMKDNKVTDIEYVESQQSVMASWYFAAGGSRGFRAVYVDGNGNPKAAPQRIFAPFGTYDGFDVAYSPVMGTFFGAFHGNSAEDFGSELGLDLSGTPIIQATASSARNGSYNPRVIAHPTQPFWLVVTSKDYAQVVVQKIVKGRPIPEPTPTRPPGSGNCVTPKPGPEWICVPAGGWLPPGHPEIPAEIVPPVTPAPAPAPAPGGGCTTPQPGSNWVCVNGGGWLPWGHPGIPPGTPPPSTEPPVPAAPAPAPAPPPPPSPPAPVACLTVKPGATWVCVNGGWLPPDHPGAQ